MASISPFGAQMGKHRHQNKYAFQHNPNSKKSAKIMAIPNVGLCQRCHDIVEWRKKFRKYKPIKNPTKCNHCLEKKVKSAYHVWCSDCAKAANVCPKCLLNKDIVQAESAGLSQEQIQEMLVSVGMKERVRRRIWRLWENEKATDEELKEMILNYNPDTKVEEGDEEEEEGDEPEEKQVSAAAMAAARAAARGPPPKPKSAAKPATASAPADSTASVAALATATSALSVTAASSSPAASATASKQEAEEEDEDEDDGEDDDDDFDGEDDDDDEDMKEIAAEKARQAAAKKP